MIEPNLILAGVAAVGALIFMALGYYLNKADNKDETFKAKYAVMTLIVILIAMKAFTSQQIEELTADNVISALIEGLGGNAALAKAAGVVSMLKDKIFGSEGI
jgi:TctA family transporter